jgi:hypothetical protein
LKTLHKYLTGQVLATMLLTVAVFSFVMLLLNVLREVLPLLFGGHISLWLVLKAIGLLSRSSSSIRCRWGSSPRCCWCSGGSAPTRSSPPRGPAA